MFFIYTYTKKNKIINNGLIILGYLLRFMWINDSIFTTTNNNFINLEKFNKSYHRNIVPNLFNRIYTHIGMIIVVNDIHHI